MIVWLASYPRSGNTLVRIMLHRVFELQSYSKYDDKLFQMLGTPAFASVGHQPLGEPWEEFYHHQRQKPGLHIIKTHDAPPDDAPAIYVVRNGLVSVSSYLDYCRVYDRKDYLLEDLILGTRGPFPSWGAHLDAWNPWQRPNTLVLKYRDLVEDPESCLSQLATFLDRPQRRPWNNNFPELNQAIPDFFRVGQIEPNPATYTAGQLELFELMHGDWLADLGYSLSPNSRHALCRTLRNAIHSRDMQLASQEAQTAAIQEAAIQTAAAAARLAEILHKEREIQNLKRICDEREELIQRLSAPLRRRVG